MVRRETIYASERIAITGKGLSIKVPEKGLYTTQQDSNSVETPSLQ